MTIQSTAYDVGGTVGILSHAKTRRREEEHGGRGTARTYRDGHEKYLFSVPLGASCYFPRPRMKQAKPLECGSLLPLSPRRPTTLKNGSMGYFVGDAGSFGRDSDAVHCNGGPAIGAEAAVYVSREDAKDLAESPWEFGRKTKKVRQSDRAPRRLCALWNPLRAFAASRETICVTHNLSRRANSIESPIISTPISP